MGGSAQHAAGADAGERANDRAGADRTAFQMAEGADLRAGFDAHAGAEDHAGADRDILGKLGVGAQEDAGGVGQRHARRHRRCAQAVLDHRLGGGEFGAAVDAAQLVEGGFDRDHLAFRCGLRDDVGQVVFAARVVAADRAQPGRHRLGWGAQHAGVAQCFGALRFGGVGGFHDAEHVAGLGEHAAVAGGVRGAHRQQCQRRAGVAAAV